MRTLLVISTMMLSTAALARDNIQIAGSSTVLPYSAIVAEGFGKAFNTFKTPVVESGGTSAGLKQFCQGVGETTIDIANASRPIKDSEIEACTEAGVQAMEVKFGYDGIVFATDVNGEKFDLTPQDLYLALNNNSTAVSWKEVRDSLPDYKIKVFIPGEKHGTREVFEEKVMLVGCKDSGQFKDKENCVQVRKDGVAIDIDGDYTETLSRISSNPNFMGVFGLSFYENNTDKIQVATMNGVVPNQDTVSSGEYPVSRPLFFYVKLNHIDLIPGLKDYIRYFISPKMVGENGPLVEYGLVPLSDEEQEKLQTLIN